MKSPAAIFYSGKLKEFSEKLNGVSRTVRWFAWYRFFAFILIFLPLVFTWQGWLTILPMLVFLSLFLGLVKRNIELEKQKQKFKILKQLTADELLALEHQFSHFDGGKEFLDTSHFYSYDLDLFGDGSIFQFLNRTSTQSGRQKLAGWLMKPPLDKNEIAGRQHAVQELSQLPEWRLEFLANGYLFKESAELAAEIKSWSETELELKQPKVLKWLIVAVPLLTFFSVIPAVFGITNYALYFMIFSQWAILYNFRKEVSWYSGFFGRKSGLFEKYMQLLNNIEGHEFKSEYLNGLRQKVTKPVSAGEVFLKLKSFVKEFEYRENILVGFILNSIFLWDVRCTFKLWQWHEKHHKRLAEWLEVVAEADALISLGNLANNHPEFIFPEVKADEFVFQTEKLGHPLLNPEKRVDNDLEINGWSKVLIVTGANMAGKSTFLRTVGVNLVLARAGAPVCARKMIFTPVGIYTDMRTTDSLLKDESYFFAELKRIKTVLERLQKGERIFVILDEMLKGTNSVDKLNGSKELIRKLVQFKSVSLIATHDLKLSEMESEFPNNIFNKCFEIKIVNGEMVFDYLLSDGVTKTMNATFLMKKMGII